MNNLKILMRVYGNVNVSGMAYSGGPISLSGWDYPVIVDFSGLILPEKIPMLIDHNNDVSAKVGQVTPEIRDDQLYIEGEIFGSTSAAKEIIKQAKAGGDWQLSIGAYDLSCDFIPEGETIAANNKQWDGPIYHVKNAKLREVSIVSIGADSETLLRIAAKIKEEKGAKMTTDDENEHEETENAVVQSKTKDEPNPVKSPGATKIDAVIISRNAVEMERRRVHEIREVCAGDFPEIEDRCICDGSSPDEARAEVLAAMRERRPATSFDIVSGGERSANVPEVLTAGLALNGGIRNPEKHFDEQTLEAAGKRRNIGIQELIYDVARMNGYRGSAFGDLRGQLRAAFSRRIEAAGGGSTIDISGILSNTANKFLLDGFSAVEDTWRRICAIRSVSDFKTVTSYRMTGALQYQLVAPGGELKHGTLGEESYTNQAKTYGLILDVTRTDIINDDLGAITQVPNRLGRGAAHKLNDVFWTEFMDNSTFFTSGRGAYQSGATTALGIDSLSAAVVLMYNQTDADSKPTGASPKYLLVPPALAAMAKQLYSSTEIRDTTASTKYPTSNIHAGSYEPIVSRYLSNSSYTGYSALAWYLLADPSDIATIEVAFLNGQESPTIESTEADFDTLGIRMRGYHDFGVALQDYRGGVKSKGEA